MTIAICWLCGAMKKGAFNPCPKCGIAPQSEDDLANSLALTDHNLSKQQLEDIGAMIATGGPINLHPETRMNMIKMIRDSGLFKHAPRAEDINYEVKKPWWKKIL